MTIARFPAKTTIYLSCGQIDMRKSINGLAAVVHASFELDPFAGALFVFCNKERNKIKVLCWDKDGFVLYYKRRERGRCPFPIKTA
jgi:Transposase and inactivated derivatives